MTIKQVTIYTDGACSGNPGPGGWGALLFYGENRKELSGAEPALSLIHIYGKVAYTKTYLDAAPSSIDSRVYVGKEVLDLLGVKSTFNTSLKVLDVTLEPVSYTHLSDFAVFHPICDRS